MGEAWHAGDSEELQIMFSQSCWRSRKSKYSSWSPIVSCWRGQTSVPFRTSSGGMQPTHIMEGNLLYSTNLSVNLISKNTFTETWKLVFAWTSGLHSLAKRTHKINNHRWWTAWVLNSYCNVIQALHTYLIRDTLSFNLKQKETVYFQVAVKKEKRFDCFKEVQVVFNYLV